MIWPPTPRMSRAQFEYIARIIAGMPDEYREKVAAEFAVHLEDTNPAFKRDRFIQAASREA